jgi:novobiocin biosynthesis protein NovU/D-mycarose 3-C-methyltransferase
MIGSNIPIVSKEWARREKPDYYLILPYGFLDEIIDEEKTYLKEGGRFIVPIPRPYVITEKGKWDI